MHYWLTVSVKLSGCIPVVGVGVRKCSVPRESGIVSMNLEESKCINVCVVITAMGVCVENIHCAGDLCEEHLLCSSTMNYQCVVIFLVL